MLTKAEPSARDMKRLKVLLGRFGRTLQDASQDRELLRQLRDLQGCASQPAGHGADKVVRQETATRRGVLSDELPPEAAFQVQADVEGLRAGDVGQIRQLLGDAEFHRLGEERARQLIIDLLD